ncbi:MAG TPA: non-canonical purine NTP pyrophosphatase [Acidimicrobiia bacterium]|nr:non-canonical purine NTP pyrophosphatase [Acidimicrobiia bacterium]
MDLPVVLATANPDKAREICEILTEVIGSPLAAWALTFADDTIAFYVTTPERLVAERAEIPPVSRRPDVEETGATLEENARIKARGVAAVLGIPTIADDTGLEVDALAGAPGVRAARYAGVDATYADNVRKLLAELDHASAERDDRRTARFATVAIAHWPDGREVATRGEVEGVITRAPRGGGGFGYDPVFAPVEGDGRTFAEMTIDEKHRLSHRGRAFRALASALAGTGGGGT